MEVYIITFLPPLLIILYFYYSDRFPEPKSSIIQVFFLGILLSLPVGFINEIFIWSVEEETGQLLSYRAGITEEFLKFLCLYFLVSKRDFFNEPMDAIVYGVTISLGFATLENFEYVFFFEEDMSWDDSLGIAAVRAISAIPMHGLCGVIMGYYLGIHCFTNKGHYVFQAIAIPMGLHALYNYLVDNEESFYLLLILFMLVYAKILHNKIKAVQLLKKSEEEYKFR